MQRWRVQPLPSSKGRPGRKRDGGGCGEQRDGLRSQGPRRAMRKGMNSFLKSALRLRKTERPALPVDGDTPGVPEELWATLGPREEAQHQMHTSATAPASQPGFPRLFCYWSAMPWQSINPTCDFTELFGKKHVCLAGVERRKVEVPAFMGFGNL